jgi:hypothetical protein
VGDVGFGDFNGDGRKDIYFSGNADMEYSLSSFVFYNQGGSFSRIDLGLTRWEHGVAVGDVDRNGIDDVLVAGYLFPVPLYLGSAGGLVKTGLTGGNVVNGYETFGSGAAFGRFLGTDELLLVMVDAAPATTGADTRLLRPRMIDGRIVGFELIATLPTPRLEDPRFGVRAVDGAPSHDVRARALDFDRDGDDDILVFSRAGFDGKGWPEQSQMQFLRNLGGGNFADVTDTVLAGYEFATNAAYSPRIADFNGDGMVDIFSSAASFGSRHDSTNLFLAHADGTFRKTGGDLFSAAIDRDGGVGTLARGPAGDWHLVSNQFAVDGARGLKSTVSVRKVSFGSEPAVVVTDWRAFDFAAPGLDARSIDWGAVDFAKLKPKQLRDIDWGAVEFDEVFARAATDGGRHVASIDWSKVDFGEFRAADYAEIPDWGRVQWREVLRNKQSVGDIDWSRVDTGQIAAGYATAIAKAAQVVDIDQLVAADTAARLVGVADAALA